MSLEIMKRQVSKELDIPYEVVNKAYNSFWQFIRSTIVKLPLKEELTEDQFNQLKTNFNIPSLGKLNCTYDRYKAIKDKYNERNKNKKD